jgi:hypothetical protein
MYYLPERFKDGAQSERAGSAARHAARERRKRRAISFELEEPPEA